MPYSRGITASSPNGTGGKWQQRVGYEPFANTTMNARFLRTPDGRSRREADIRVRGCGLRSRGKAVVRGFDRNSPSLTPEEVNDREFAELS